MADPNWESTAENLRLRDYAPTGELRWWRPPGGTDTDLQLQQEWMQGQMGYKVWARVPIVLGD